VAKTVWTGLNAVVAGVAIALAGAEGTAAAAPSGVTIRTVTYNVSVFASNFSEVRTPITRGSQHGFQVRNQDIWWSGEWKKVGLRIATDANHRVLYVIETKPGFSGKIDASAGYSYHDPEFVYQPVECDGSVGIQHYKARSNLSFFDSRSKIGATFLSQPNDAGRAFFKTLDGAEKASCDGRRAIISVWDNQWKARDGVTIDPAAELLSLQWRRQGSASAPPFPIQKLLRGRAFTIDGGTHSENTAHATKRESARIEFTPKGKLEIKKLDLRNNIGFACPLSACPLQYLSVADDYHTGQGTIFGANTLIQGLITIKGEKDNSLRSLELQVLDGGVPVARAQLAPGPRSQLIGPTFGSDQKLAISTLPQCPQCLFKLPQEEAAKVNLTDDARLTLRVRAVADDGQVAEKTYGDVTKLVRYLGANRFGVRDLGFGGDDWALPSVKAVMDHYAAGHCYNDFSKMNAGPFGNPPQHKAHDRGDDVDVRFDSPKACAQGGSIDYHSAGDAQKILNDLNDPTFGPRVRVIFAKFSYSNSNPFWTTIRDAPTVSGGRHACRVIHWDAAHGDHLHYRIDRDVQHGGWCPGDPTPPPQP
jgi:hypothetical protein